MEVVELANLLAGFGTLAGAALVFVQLRIGNRQDVQRQVSEYNSRYMEIAARLPYEIFVSNQSLEEACRTFGKDYVTRAIYDYMLLCEEQANLIWDQLGVDLFGGASGKGAVSQFFRFRDPGIWRQAHEEWRSGIVGNLSRPALRDGFHEVISRLDSAGLTKDFENLRKHLGRENGPTGNPLRG